MKNLREGLQELMARRQKVLPEVEEISDGIPLQAHGNQHESAPSAQGQPEKPWRSMSQEPRQASAGQLSVLLLRARCLVPIGSRAMKLCGRSTSKPSRNVRLLVASSCPATRCIGFSRRSRFLSDASSRIKEVCLIPTNPLCRSVEVWLLERLSAVLMKPCTLATAVRRPFASLTASLLRKHHQAAGNATSLTLDADGAKVESLADPTAKPCIKRRLSPARASWLYVSRSSTLNEKQRGQIEQIRACHADLDTAYQLTQTFVTMLAEHRETGLDEWLTQAEHCGIKELKSFAQGIRRDYAAVRATFTSQWSNGPVEAQVNCLKLQKRIVFGRANFDLLLGPARPLTWETFPLKALQLKRERDAVVWRMKTRRSNHRCSE